MKNITIIVKLANYLREIYNWTNYIQTLIFGLVFTFFMLWPGIILAIGLIFAFKYPTYVLKKVIKLGKDIKFKNKSYIDL